MDWEYHYFRYWRPSINFCHVDVSADARVKGMTICNGETCIVDDLLYSAARNISNFITQSICLG